MDISVIVPFYDGNKYIEKLLIVIQKNRNNLAKDGFSSEVIIVNDSPDIPVTVKDRNLLADVTVLANPHNEGIHQSRVNGLNTAKGKYVLFLDQDDLISKHGLLSQIKTIGSYDFVVGNGYKTDSQHKYELYKTSHEQEKCLKLDYYYYYTCPIISPGLVLIRKNAIPEEWKTNILQHNGSDDFYLWLLMLSDGAKGTINRDHVYMHVYTGQNTSLDQSYMRESTYECVQKMKGIIPDSKLRCIMRRADYYSETKGNFFDKCKYLDVGVLRFLFGRLL